MSGRWPRWTYRELTAFLRTQGCEKRREAAGSHEIWWHPAKRLYTTVPRHSGTLDTGTLRKILRDLDLAWQRTTQAEADADDDRER